RASFHDNGTLMIFGSDTASRAAMRRAPGSDGHPGVSGSPGTRKSYTMPPRWMWLSGPHGPSGFRVPFLDPSSAGSEQLTRRGTPRHRLALSLSKGHLDADVGGVGEQHVVLGDRDLFEAVLAPAIADPFGERAVARRSGDVRFGGEERMRVTRFIGRGECEKASLDRSFGGGRARGEPVNLGRLGNQRR